jgi:phosphate transport system permease protein
MRAENPASPLHGQRPSRRRLWTNRMVTAAMFAAVVVTLTPVCLILYQLVTKGLVAMSWQFLTQTMPYTVREVQGGFFNALVGTLIMVGIASLISIPIGVVAAIYLAEYGKKSWFAQLVRFLTDVMTGVPSVFVGLFVYTALVVQFGFGALLGGFALAIIMLPIVVRSTEEMLKLVPGDLKNAGYALGAAKWQVVLFVTLPSALPGITTGVMLAVARAAGETAPLILTALGAQAMVTKLVDAPISALPLAIFSGARQPFPAGQAMAWAGALELVVIVLLCTLLAQLAASRSRITR